MIIIGYALVAFLVLIDQLSKYFILNTIKIGNAISIIPGVIDFRPVYNTGAAFSMFNEYTAILGFISIISIIVISFFMKNLNFKNNKIYSYSIVLIFSGAFGNMIDRLLNKKGVFDFIELKFINFAIFNFADICLTMGFILLAIYMIMIEGKDKKYEKR